MEICIADFSFIVLVGGSGSGKSSFARKHFKATEIVSSDRCRALIADDEQDQNVSEQAFELLHFIVDKRLAQRKLTVVDATNLEAEARATLLGLGKKHQCQATAIVFTLPLADCLKHNRARPDRQVSETVVREHSRQMNRHLHKLEKEKFAAVYRIESTDQARRTVIKRRPMASDLNHNHGPFDIIGDIHGCYAELLLLLEKLGYRRSATAEPISFRHPQGRQVIFLGDVVDRGPDSPAVLRLTMAMVKAGQALFVAGNHDAKLCRKLQGRNVVVRFGLEETLRQLDREPPEFIEEVTSFIKNTSSHYMLDEGKLAVSHAGITEALQGRDSERVWAFAFYGQTTGETDEFGLPVRYNWAQDYRGRALVVYGHTPVKAPFWQNGTVCLDTGCVYGGKLTALRYPERTIVQVQAARVYYQSQKPLTMPTESDPPPESSIESHDGPPVSKKQGAPARFLFDG